MTKVFWVGVILFEIFAFQSRIYSQNTSKFQILQYNQAAAIDLNELKKMTTDPIIRDGKPPLVNKYLMEYFADFDLSWDGQSHNFKFRNDLPHAGSEAFIDYIYNILNKWEFPKAPQLQGCTIRYSIHADNNDGFIKIKFIDSQGKSISKLMLSDTSISLGDNYSGLVKAINFKPRNIILPSIKKDLATFSFSWWKDLIFNKIQVLYSIIFVLILIVLIVFSILVFSRNRNDKPDDDQLVKCMVLLWEKSTFFYQSSVIKENDKSEIVMDLTMDIYSKNVDEKLEALDGINKRLEDPAAVLHHLDDIKSDLRPSIGENDLKQLKTKLDAIIAEIKSEKDASKKARGNSARKEIEIELKINALFERAYAMVWYMYTKPHLLAAIRASKKCTGSPIAKILESGIQKHLKNKYYWNSFQEVTRAITKKAQAEIDKMNLGLDWVWTISGFAPMLGLLGTVTGIERSFDAISKAPAGLQDSVMNSLASGINEALYTTIIGLIIGVFATLLYYWFKTRIDENSFTWESVYQRISERI